jgi:serine/threonine protein kinase
LGKGGFGITYLAEDTIKKQQIVIKTLNANQQGEADFVQKQGNFVNEGFMLKTFNHPHIVKVYEMIQVGDLSGLVMEYIPGQDLADYIIANGRLGEAEALNYIDQIAQALDCVHQQKFFHRDVKPHNIMLRQDRGEAVLIDFGIAKEFVDLETIYLSNSLGTELYKPIEQYEKRGQFGAYTNIYALAVTLYHLLTGAAPGGGSPLYTSKARKDAQDNGGGEQIEKCLWEKLANAGVSERTQAAIKAGMAIEPSQRPQTMMEFRKSLGLVKERLVEIESGKTWFENGNELLHSCKFEEALSSYDHALEFEPENPNIFFNYRIILRILDRKDPPIQSCHDLSPNPNRDVWKNYAWHKIVNRQNRQSSIYGINEKSNPSTHYEWCHKGEVLQNLERYEEAIISYNRALEICPNHLCSLSLCAKLLYKLERYEEAILYFTRYLKLKVNNSDVFIHHGDALAKTKMYEDAILSYDHALKINPNYYKAWYDRGLCLSKLGRYEEAVSSYDQFLEIHPDNRQVSKNRQIAIDELGKASITR